MIGQALCRGVTSFVAVRILTLEYRTVHTHVSGMNEPSFGLTEYTWVVYSGPEGLVLTGIGVYDDPRRGAFIAPPDTGASWDSYELSDDDAFGANQQSPRNNRHGFLFHVACWHLLEECFQPDPVPLLRLFEVLNSLPFPLGSKATNWGHNYGSLSLLNGKDFYPWMDWRRFMEEPEPEHIIDRCNPYDISAELVALLAVVPDHEEFTEHIHSLDNTIETSTAVIFSEDCFNRLPVELCLSIASCLPTSDALHARMASRAFWPIFYDQQFWANKFQPGGMDRSWLFEVHGKRCLDWRRLYRYTQNFRLSPALRNRKRVWALVQHVSRILDLQDYGLTSKSTSLPKPQHHLAPLPDLSVSSMPGSITVSGHLKYLKPGNAFSDLDRGCRILYKRRFQIPKNLTKVAISIVDIGGTLHIAGLDFTSATGEGEKVGYCSKYYATDSVEVSRLWGFHIALGDKGLYGLRCVFEGGEQSRWLGNVSESLRTERLAHSGSPLEELELGFDVMHPLASKVSATNPSNRVAN